MTPLQQLINLEKDALEFGFEWPNYKMILDQVKSECQEIEGAIEQGLVKETQEEIGDLLHAALGLCIFLGFDVEETLSKTNYKFSHRMAALKVLTRDHELKNLQGQSIDFMLQLWKKAKETTAP